MKIQLIISGIIFLLASCQYGEDTANEQKPEDIRNQKYVKPASSYQDTLTINYPAAVFYHPDSIQLQKIKSPYDSMVFNSIEHEFFYQMRNARMVIKKTWPLIKIVEAKNYRYLLFIKKDNSVECMDLDNLADAFGLIVFDTQQNALPVDMMNIETNVSFYLKKN